jgi:hypothetical protein
MEKDRPRGGQWEDETVEYCGERYRLDSFERQVYLPE